MGGAKKNFIARNAREARAKICHFNAKIDQIEDICALKLSQRKMHITTFDQFVPEFRAR